MRSKLTATILRLPGYSRATDVAPHLEARLSKAGGDYQQSER